MSLAGNGLRAAYNRAVDFKALREVLRLARDAKNWTLDQAADKAHLNRATIHSIENVKGEPDLKPELETIEKLVLAYDMKLSAFFAKLEGETISINPDVVLSSSPPHSIITAGDVERLARIIGEAIGKSIRDETRASRKEQKSRSSSRFRRPATVGDHPRKDRRSR